jgi:hypothetical protein
MEELFKFRHDRYIVSEFESYCKIEDGNIDEILGVKISNSKIGVKNHFDFKMEHTGEDEYVKNYANPLCAINHSRYSIFVTKTDDKVCIKTFTYYRGRGVGRKYFKVQTLVQYVTYNFKTNSLYTGSITNYHLKRKFIKKVNRNSFNQDPINRMKSFIKSELAHILNRNPELSIDKVGIIENVFKTFITSIPGHEKYPNISYEYVPYKMYLDKNNIKTPNNWAVFMLSQHHPKKKDFTKNKLKFIDTFMSMYHFKGDKIKKILHNINQFNGSGFFESVCNLFGKDFIMSQPDKVIMNILESSNYPNSRGEGFFQSKKEKNNCFEIFKLVLNGEIDYHTFNDHFSMISNLRRFETVRWESNDYNSFNDEHFSISERLGFYNNGDFNRIYNEEFVNKLEEVVDESYYPVVLRTSKEYNMESHLQSNCVKGYVNRAGSFIVSLRNGSDDSKERATIEYHIILENEKVRLKRAQTLGRFNSHLDESWNRPLVLLDIRIEKLVNSNLFDLPKVELKVGNKTFNSESIFTEEIGLMNFIHGPNLKWVDERITNIRARNTLNYNDVAPLQFNGLELNF